MAHTAKAFVVQGGLPMDLSIQGQRGCMADDCLDVILGHRKLPWLAPHAADPLEKYEKMRKTPMSADFRRFRSILVHFWCPGGPGPV